MTAEIAPRRRLPSKCPWITGLRLKPFGGDATLLNISQSGLLARCGTRVVPGTVVQVEFEGTFTPASVHGRVTRCEVAAIAENGGIQYNIGITFSQPISFPDDEEVPAEEHAAQTAPEPMTIRNRW